MGFCDEIFARGFEKEMTQMVNMKEREPLLTMTFSYHVCVYINCSFILFLISNSIGLYQ